MLSVLVFLLFGLARPLGYSQDSPELEPPALLYPAKDSLIRFPGTEAKIPFKWMETEGADSYEINVLVGNRPAAQAKTENTEIELNLGLAVREAQATVRWSVRAFAGEQAGPISDIFSFKFGNQEGTPIPGTPSPTRKPSPTPTPLPAPVLLQPEDKQEFDALHGLEGIEFNWETISGASSYEFHVYMDNEIIVQKHVLEPPHTESFSLPIQKVYQWNVFALDESGQYSLPSLRRSFRIGADVYPTPTPLPRSADLNQDGKIDAHDIYLYASRHATNDPTVDFNHNGLNDAEDILLFTEMYRK